MRTNHTLLQLMELCQVLTKLRERWQTGSWCNWRHHRFIRWCENGMENQFILPQPIKVGVYGVWVDKGDRLKNKFYLPGLLRRYCGCSTNAEIGLLTTFQAIVIFVQNSKFMATIIIFFRQHEIRWKPKKQLTHFTWT